jgi:hypothetical protein
MDDRTPDQILAEIGSQARTACNAELDFFEWRADHQHHDFPVFMKRYQGGCRLESRSLAAVRG